MSKPMIDDAKLRSYDTSGLFSLEHQVLGSIDREITQRREEKHKPKKKKRRGRR